MKARKFPLFSCFFLSFYCRNRQDNYITTRRNKKHNEQQQEKKFFFIFSIATEREGRTEKISFSRHLARLSYEKVLFLDFPLYDCVLFPLFRVIVHCFLTLHLDGAVGTSARSMLESFLPRFVCHYDRSDCELAYRRWYMLQKGQKWALRGESETEDGERARKQGRRDDSWRHDWNFYF